MDTATIAAVITGAPAIIASIGAFFVLFRDRNVIENVKEDALKKDVKLEGIATEAVKDREKKDKKLDTIMVSVDGNLSKAREEAASVRQELKVAMAKIEELMGYIAKFVKMAELQSVENQVVARTGVRLEDNKVKNIDVAPGQKIEMKIEGKS